MPSIRISEEDREHYRAMYEAANKKTKFTLEIEMGNDAMLTGEDIAEALSRVAQALNPSFSAAEPTLQRKILDLNGNVVGFYQIIEY